MALLSNRAHEERPWGSFRRFTLNEPCTVKVVSVQPLQRLSLQTHARRTEFWHILSGDGEVTIDGDVHQAKVGDEFEVLVGMQHRIAAGPNGLSFLEIALGDFDERDITRLSDDYSRQPSTS